MAPRPVIGKNQTVPSNLRDHWDAVYEVDPATKKWHQDVPTMSLEMLEAAGVGPEHAVIDIGGGASRLAEFLVADGFRDVTVLDVSERGLQHARHRLGSRAGEVTWLVGDVTRHEFARTFDVWHDRAVFHFLSDEGDRAGYLERLEGAVAPGGHAIIATFGPGAPEYCSGLPVVRYDAQHLAGTIGRGFDLVRTVQEEHRTPGGEVQPFTWALLRRSAESRE